MKQAIKFKRKQIYAVLFILIIFITISNCKKIVRPDYADKYINVPIKEIVGFYQGSDVILDKDNKFNNIIISGAVTSDASSGNNPIGKGIAVQEGSLGIFIPIEGNASDISVRKGDSVHINVEHGTVTAINGNIAIKGITPADISVLSKKASLSPQTVVIQDLTAHFSKYTGSLVKVAGAKVVNHKNGEVYSGNKELEDGTKGSIQLHTASSASFANDTIPAYGTFTGIAAYGSDSNKELWMRDTNDLEEFVPSPYPPDFPERFDTSIKKSHYATADVNLQSGKWTLAHATLVTKTSSRPINTDGTKAVQFNKTNVGEAHPDEYLQMDFDVHKGAKKVTILYGRYAIDEPSVWELEYSTDEGQSWTKIGDDIITDNKSPKTAVFKMDIKGKVRFRVHKFASDGKNGRLNVDDFAIYNNF